MQTFGIFGFTFGLIAFAMVNKLSKNEGAESVRLIEQTGGKNLFIRADVSIEEDIANMVAKTVEA